MLALIASVNYFGFEYFVFYKSFKKLEKSLKIHAKEKAFIISRYFAAVTSHLCGSNLMFCVCLVSVRINKTLKQFCDKCSPR